MGNFVNESENQEMKDFSGKNLSLLPGYHPPKRTAVIHLPAALRTSAGLLRFKTSQALQQNVPFPAHSGSP